MCQKDNNLTKEQITAKDTNGSSMQQENLYYIIHDKREITGFKFKFVGLKKFLERAKIGYLEL